MGRRKKVDSENIKNDEINAVNNSEIGFKETKTCDRDVVTSITLDSALPSSCPDSSACRPANTIENLNAPVISEGNRLNVSHSILDSVTAVEQEWPRSVIITVQKRFERMPRNGWSAILRYYNRKFGRTVDIDVLKKLKQNNAEREITQEENRERRRIAPCLAETCSLTDTTLYMNLREKFLCKIKEISEKEIGDVVVRTRKLPSELVDSKNVSDSARIIQAAQVCYYEETRKEKPRSAWKENIESKISKSVLSKEYLEKAHKLKKHSSSETKIRCMRVGSNSEKRTVCLSYSEIDSIDGYLSALNPSI
ncbi:hypothetical protein CWI36_1540p0010 [Hamiltosporidium magnivora]|uniref:Uncharacterized protein n=1 Tax=Hamiltosporidium magnivora TaxID=148818 RepID=A0A4V2JUM7_9MICR|nr:hypothetical protein CWI36_1540p0010 [Hamiltosporidium magnivora]